MIRPPCRPTTPIAGALVAALLLAAPPVAAQTYRIVGPDGRVTFSDRKPTDAAVKASVLGKPAPATAATNLPPGLWDASLGVLGRESLVQSVWDTCTRLIPRSYDRYDDALRAWRKHNAAVVAKTDRILFSAFTSEQRDQIHAAALARLEAQMAPVAKADQAAKLQWCEQWAKDLNAGAPELATDTALAGPIMAYTLP